MEHLQKRKTLETFDAVNRLTTTDTMRRRAKLLTRRRERQRDDEKLYASRRRDDDGAESDPAPHPTGETREVANGHACRVAVSVTDPHGSDHDARRERAKKKREPGTTRNETKHEHLPTRHDGRTAGD
jgi:hypothetical protein